MALSFTILASILVIITAPGLIALSIEERRAKRQLEKAA